MLQARLVLFDVFIFGSSRILFFDLLIDRFVDVNVQRRGGLFLTGV